MRIRDRPPRSPALCGAPPQRGHNATTSTAVADARPRWQDRPGSVEVRGRTFPVRPDFTALREAIRGQLFTSFDPGYEPARVLFNTRIRTRPAAIVRCAETADVVKALGF